MMPLAAIPESAWQFLGGGVLVLWCVREFLGHKAKQTAGVQVSPEQIKGLFRRLDTLTSKVDDLARDLETLFAMHDHTDEDGVYVWHVRRSLIRTIQALEDGLVEIVDLVREHGAQLNTHGARLDELVRRDGGGA